MAGTAGRDMLVVGEVDDRPSGRIDALRALLAAAGMHSPPTGDIRQSVWDKLLLNFGSSLCVPLGEPVSALASDPALRAVRERIVGEGRAIARAAGVPAPTLEAVHALVARMAARKGLYSSA